jgi:hypothetical protein
MEAARICAAASGLPRSKPELLLMAQAMNCMPTGEVTIATLSDAIKNARLGQGPHPARVTMVPPEIHVGPNGEPQMLHGPRWNLHTQLGSTLLHEQLPFRPVASQAQSSSQAERHQHRWIPFCCRWPLLLEQAWSRTKYVFRSRVAESAL